MIKGLISVIVPSYNVAKNIPYCLDSLSKQTYKNIEIICVNDGSTDETLEIINNYIQKDPRIKVYSKENGGLSSARNHGLNFAQGEFIAFVDSDDFVDIRFFEKLINLINEHDADIARCRGRGVKSYDYVEPEPDSINISVRNSQQAINIFYDGKFYGWYADDASVVWNCLYRTEVIKNLRFNPILSPGEDDCFVQQAICESKKIVYSDERLYFYYYNEGGLCRKKHTPKKRLLNTTTLYDELQNYFAEKGLMSILQKNAKCACDNICEVYVDLKDSEDKKNAIAYFKKFYKSASDKTKILKIFNFSPFLYKVIIKYFIKH